MLHALFPDPGFPGARRIPGHLTFSCRTRKTMQPFAQFPSFRLPLVVSALLWAYSAGSAPAFAAAGELRAELETLAAQAGFPIEGLDRVDPEPAGIAHGALAERLKVLLQDYNYLIIETAPGTIKKVLITSRKRSESRKSASGGAIETTRLGTHHQVEAMVVGPNGVSKTLPLLIDTGASMIVLPNSMAAELGFLPEQLQGGVSRTASGTVPVKIGVLSSVWVGPVSAADVQVSFIDDRRLNGALLLGMSFLNRFRMTIDDAKNELILFAK